MEQNCIEFNTKIKTLREILGYTQQQVADYLGIDKTTYAHYEAGRRLPNMEKLRKLAILYGLQDEMLNVLLPVEATIKYPKAMLDKAEKCLNEAMAVDDKSYEQLNKSLNTLEKVYEPIFRIRSEALKLPESVEDYLMAGQNKNIKKVYLDVRGESLIDEYIKVVKMVNKAMKRRHMQE